MMKFACFERTVEALYKFVVPKPRSECNKAEQLLVTFVAGYIGKSLVPFGSSISLEHFFIYFYGSELGNAHGSLNRCFADIFILQVWV